MDSLEKEKKPALASVRAAFDALMNASRDQFTNMHHSPAQLHMHFQPLARKIKTAATAIKSKGIDYFHAATPFLNTTLERIDIRLKSTPHGQADRKYATVIDIIPETTSDPAPLRRQKQKKENASYAIRPDC